MCRGHEKINSKGGAGLWSRNLVQSDIYMGKREQRSLYAVEPGMTEHDDSPDADEQAVKKLEIYTDPPQSEDEPASRPWKAGRYKRKYTW